MTLWAIVPVKPLRRGKSRLAGVISEKDREILNQYLLEHTLTTLKTIPQIGHILVVSRDPAALALAREKGARTVQENGSPNLNVALERATAVVRGYGASGVLILPSDLPLLTGEDIYMMLSQSADLTPPLVVVAPDRRREGTNALLVMPPGMVSYQFGEDSFERHCAQARRAGAALRVCEVPSLTLDLDEPDDLVLVESALPSIWEHGQGHRQESEDLEL